MKTAIRQLEARLLSCEQEFGPSALKDAVIIGPLHIKGILSNKQYIMAPTFADHTLGCVDWKVARFFENIIDKEPSDD